MCPVLGIPPVRRAAMRITLSTHPRQGDQHGVCISNQVDKSEQASSSSGSEGEGDGAELPQLVVTVAV